MKIVTKRFFGSCLEGIGFPCKGFVEIDKDAKPKVGDVVYCSGAIGGEVTGMLKQVIHTGKPYPIVHTCYKDRTQDFAYFAVETFGVVLRAFDEAGTLCWERDKNVFMLTCPRCGADMDGGEIYERSKRNMDLYDRGTSGGNREGI